jgi:hypothetical protein
MFEGVEFEFIARDFKSSQERQTKSHTGSSVISMPYNCIPPVSNIATRANLFKPGIGKEVNNGTSWLCHAASRQRLFFKLNFFAWEVRLEQNSFDHLSMIALIAWLRSAG